MHDLPQFFVPFGCRTRVIQEVVVHKCGRVLCFGYLRKEEEKEGNEQLRDPS